MRIGLFTSIDGWGGSETYLRSLMLGLRERGQNVVLFGVGGSRLMGEMTALGVECHVWTGGRTVTVLPTGDSSAPASRGAARRIWHAMVLPVLPEWLKMALGARRETRHLARLFGAAGLDLVHVNVHGYEMAGMACRRAGIPCLAMYLTFPHDESNGFRRWLMRRTIRSYDHVTAQSDACRRAWCRRTGISVDRTSFIWNSADPLRFENLVESVRRAPRDSCHVVAVGRLHAMKGFRYLIEGLAVSGDRRIQVDIVGEGPERGALQALIDRHGLAAQVRLRGHLENPEELLGCAHVFVLPSVQFESGPAALAEAMMACLPCLTSDFGPLPEMNLDGETGLVVPAGSSIALGNALRRLADEPELARRFGRAARARAMACFTRAAMVDATLAVYVRVLAARRMAA